MGYYIQTPEPTGKAAYLREHHGAIAVEPVEPSALAPDQALVCVIENAGFDAAAYCYNDREFQEFALPDDRRPREWLLMDRAIVERLSSYGQR